MTLYLAVFSINLKFAGLDDEIFYSFALYHLNVIRIDDCSVFYFSVLANSSNFVIDF